VSRCRPRYSMQQKSCTLSARAWLAAESAWRSPQTSEPGLLLSQEAQLLSGRYRYSEIPSFDYTPTEWAVKWRESKRAGLSGRGGLGRISDSLTCATSPARALCYPLEIATQGLTILRGLCSRRYSTGMLSPVTASTTKIGLVRFCALYKVQRGCA
jgi:hypothetical protein